MTRLEQLRLDSLMTREALGEAAGVSAKTIGRMEQGSGARIATLARLSTYFGVPASDLLRPVAGDSKAAA